MRTLEVLLVILSIPAVAWTLMKRSAWPWWIRFLTVVAILFLPAHAWFEGMHWQMIPIYTAVVIEFVMLVAHLKARTITRLAMLTGTLILAGLAICFTLPMFHLPKPTGPYPIGTRTLFFVDPSRQESHPRAPHIPREVVVQVWYPSATSTGKHAFYRRLKETDPRSTYQTVLRVDALQDSPIAAGQFPVIIFNHAWRGFRNRSTFIMQELASQGFVVVGVSHPWNSAMVELHDGRVADGRGQLDLGNFYSKPPLTLEQRLALSQNEMRTQTIDDKFLLDRLTLLNQSGSSPLAGHMDLTHVGAFGHSFGGAVSAELASEDQRVKSAIILDGVLTGPVGQTGLNKPLFRIMAEAAFMPKGSENSPIQSTRVHAQMSLLGENALAASFAKYGGYQVVITGIDHENFSDKGFFSPFHSLSGIGEIPQPRAARIIDDYIVAFFKQTLKGETQPLLSDTHPPYPEVRSFKEWPQRAASTAPEKTAAN